MGAVIKEAWQGDFKNPQGLDLVLWPRKDRVDLREVGTFQLPLVRDQKGHPALVANDFARVSGKTTNYNEDHDNRQRPPYDLLLREE